jgi:hypothetical protein
MFRAVCALAGLIAFAVPPLDVDAAAFALAFRAGRADEFKNKQISGAGTSFHGAIAERIADGSTRTSLVITLGSAGRDGKLTPLNAWDDFVAADRAHTTVVVALSGPNLPVPLASGPTVYEFSGVYDGQVRTIARAPLDPSSSVGNQGSSSVGQGFSPDSGPCPGEKPREQSQSGGFYCAPLLTGATATIRR